MKRIGILLTTSAMITAPIVVATSCGLNDEMESKQVTTQEEGRELFAKIVHEFSSGATVNYNAFVSKSINPDNPGFTFNVRFSQVYGRAFSSGSFQEQYSEYKSLASQVWQKTKQYILNPFQMSISWTEGTQLGANSYFGYAHGCENLWTNNPKYQDNQLYVR